MENDKTKRPVPEQEIGSAKLIDLPPYFGAGGDEISDQIKNVQEMLDKDAIVQAALNVIVLPILSAQWTITPWDKENTEGDDQAAQVTNFLTRPVYAGGMTKSFQTFLAQCMQAIGFGFSAFEKVYKVDPESNIVYKKLLYLPSGSVAIKTDERGGFDGFTQQAIIGEETKEVDIPVEKSFLFTHQDEVTGLRGRSSLTTAYGYYIWKRRFYYLMQQKAQFDSFGHLLITEHIAADEKFDDPSEEDIKKTVNTVASLKQKGVVYASPPFKIEQLLAQQSFDPLATIEHLNSEILRSILAAFMLLGGQQSAGSWALSRDQSDLFLQSIQKTARSVESHITNFILPDLYVNNFSNPAFGVFKIADFSDETSAFIKRAFEEMVAQDKLTDEFANEIGKNAASQMGITEDFDQFIKQTEFTPDEDDNPEEDQPEEEPEDPDAAPEPEES